VTRIWRGWLCRLRRDHTSWERMPHTYTGNRASRLGSDGVRWLRRYSYGASSRARRWRPGLLKSATSGATEQRIAGSRPNLLCASSSLESRALWARRPSWRSRAFRRLRGPRLGRRGLALVRSG
jgi:hypothetical protein